MNESAEDIEKLIMSIPIKQKKCKANTKAQGFKSCDKEVYRFKFGMCRSCFRDWCTGTEEGKAYFNSQRIKVTALAVKNVQQTASKTYNKEKKDRRDKKKHWNIELQPEINHIARLIDKGQPCTATKLTRGKWNGGHVFSVGSNNTTRFNLHNVHIQCVHSNKYSNDDAKMRLGIRRVYGDNYGEFVKRIQSTPAIHYSNVEYHEFTTKARGIVRRLKKVNNVYSKGERIQLRNDINEELNIYDFEFCVF